MLSKVRMSTHIAIFIRKWWAVVVKNRRNLNCPRILLFCMISLDKCVLLLRSRTAIYAIHCPPPTEYAHRGNCLIRRRLTNNKAIT